MKLSVFLDSVERDKALADFVYTRTEQALNRHKKSLEAVEVRIRNISGTKGIVEWECKIVVTSRLSAPVVVKTTHVDSGQAFRAALKKLLPNLRDSLDKTIFREKRSRKLLRSFKEAA